MTKENILRLHEHFKNLAEHGVKTNNEIRDALIKADAKRNLERLEAKFDYLQPKVEVEDPEAPKRPRRKPKSNSEENEGDE